MKARRQVFHCTLQQESLALRRGNCENGVPAVYIRYSGRIFRGEVESQQRARTPMSKAGHDAAILVKPDLGLDKPHASTSSCKTPEPCKQPPRLVEPPLSVWLDLLIGLCHRQEMSQGVVLVAFPTEAVRDSQISGSGGQLEDGAASFKISGSNSKVVER